MADHSPIYSRLLEAEPQWLRRICRGVEKESLRISGHQATLAQTPHPVGLGSALTHSAITTDYSEALLEFITPVSSSISDTEQALADLHRFTARQLGTELLWNASMPCIVHGDADIPIAEFGSSNVGQMKRIYRNGLSVRYGRKMQAIAGIHYNFSLPESFWARASEVAGDNRSQADFQTAGYLALIRNFFSRVWLLLYLLGCSPAVCASFVQGNRSHPLRPMGDDHHSYNDLDQYISTLRSAILRTHPPYTAFDYMDNGERAQLNTSLLQIENEYYSPIRPKRVTGSGEAPILALTRGGIEYVEVRCVDINPFVPFGIDGDTMRLLDLFLLSCLADASPACDEAGQRRNKTNLQRTVTRGRDPELTLLSEGDDEVSLSELAQPILNRMSEIADWFDRDANHNGQYQRIAEEAREKVIDPSLTPSARLLNEMDSSGQSFWQIAKKYSGQWHNEHLSQPVDNSVLASLEAEARASIERQRKLEADDEEPFEAYLARFYSQYS